ncbi:hypothetical protein L1280_000144 [Deinococcus sp. HSC-46F16]|uniref:hypothetical protein n=1 Tax=Deinococcus sp. HSC-46F16 TaxID=2910968 RepID=UPI00209D2697|nr:hypothetical protein [Deinococcus sp. HSC-46F16]MCP2013016.1 hypothetical protein [Deinococcus sp. HSC-46F16]
MRPIWTALLALASAGLAANTSLYTSLEPGACRNLVTDPSGAGYVRDLCSGVGGYQLLVEEGDLRQNVTVRRGGVQTSLELWSVVGSAFSSLGPRAEWRLKAGVPVALILRYNLSDPVEASKVTSYLVVARLGARPCVVARIAPVPQQNVRARQAADGAAGRSCLRAP